MPYPGVPAGLTDKMERCVEKVMKQGKDKKSAIAICHRSVVGGGIRDEAQRRLKKG